MSKDKITYKSVPPSPDIAAKVFRLYERVYGDAQSFINRWDWEFMQHPRSSEIMLHCAEMNDELVGMTVRHPVSITYRGKLIKACFASNTMVVPETRGKGVVRELYRMAAENGTLQLSKGTATAMYSILKKIGYKDIFPSTFQQIYLRPFRILLKRLTGMHASVTMNNFSPEERDEMRPVFSIPEDISNLRSPDGIIKDADYLRWRYIEIPHKTYQIFVRRNSSKLVSMLVLRIAGTKVYIVDIIWDREYRDEPATSLAFAKKAARRMGAYKMKAWSTSSDVRNVLGKLNFIDKGESPHFSFFCTDPYLTLEWHSMNIEHGEGDIDYL